MDLVDPLKVLMAVNSGSLEALLKGDAEPQNSGQSKLGGMLDGVSSAPSTDAGLPDLKQLKNRLTELEGIISQQHLAVEDNTRRERWTADEQQAQALEWSPLQQEVRLLAMDRATGGKFIAVNDKQAPLDVHFEIQPPFKKIGVDWSADVNLIPSTLALQPGESSVVHIRFEPGSSFIRPQTLEFCVDMRDQANQLVSKLWVHIDFASID
ncbi:MAG: hypothetical protein KUG79_15165 [Pseudomonadales bacterium]|nr:hypothetical protein [Pseudomonadales bacterium]